MSGRTPIRPPTIPGGLEFKGLDFSGVVLRIFPLRANMVRLRRFVDDYLNMDLPPEVARFEPLLPTVYLMVVNYGQMSPVASNLGWVAQHEVAFSVMVQGSWHEDGRRVSAPASVSPFIFIDSDQSMISGREIYGWPKYPATLAPDIDPWLQDPRQPRRLMDLRTPMFRQLYAGRPLEPLTLLELEQQEPHLFAQLPPGIDYLLNPLAQLPRAILGGLAAAPDLLAGQVRSVGGAAAEPLAGMLDGLLGQMRAPSATASVNTLNLKQFRFGDPGPETADTAAYQALVNARMVFKKIHGSGLLGSVELMRGDPTAGFALRVHRNPAFPIVQTLGLEVERTLHIGDELVDLVQPQTPFWVAADLGYEPARRLCWRTHNSDWSTSERREPAEPSRPVLFNTTLGPLVDAVEGPFEFEDVIWRVLPLAASTGALERLPPQTEWTAGGHTYRLEPYFKDTSWVFLVVGSYGEMSSAANNLGWWTDRELGIAVPFRLKADTIDPLFEAWKRGDLKILGLDAADPDIKKKDVKKKLGQLNEEGICCLYWPYIFLGSPVAVTEGREMRGVPASFGTLRRGRDPWATSGDPDRHRELLSVDTVDYPALGVGQGSREQRLLELRSVPDPAAADARGQPTKARAKELSQVLEEGLRVPNLALKQFPDEVDPRLACYRALVAYDHVLRSPSAGRRHSKPSGEEPPTIGVYPLAGSYEVRLHELPSYPIARHLGLTEAERGLVSATGSAVTVCQVHNPFWMRFTLQLSLPITLWSQSVDGEWRRHLAEDYFRSWFQHPPVDLGGLGTLPEQTLGAVLRELPTPPKPDSG